MVFGRVFNRLLRRVDPVQTDALIYSSPRVVAEERTAKGIDMSTTDPGASDDLHKGAHDPPPGAGDIKCRGSSRGHLWVMVWDEPLGRLERCRCGEWRETRF